MSSELDKDIFASSSGGTPSLPSSVVNDRAPAPSGDETGATDTAALEAAMPARGSLELRDNADYYVTKLPPIGPGQGLTSRGLGTVIHMVGSGVCLHIRNPSFPLSGEKGYSFANNMPNKCGPFVIDMTNAGEGAVGVKVGDILCPELDGVIVRHTNKTGSIGWLFESEVGWCERIRILNCHAIDCTEHVVFSNSGTGTSSFDYSHIQISLSAFANQHGIVMKKAASLIGCRLKFCGNFHTGAANTGVVWKIGEDNTAVFIDSELDFTFECNQEEGTTGHIAYKLGTAAEVRARNSTISYAFGNGTFQEGNLVKPNARFVIGGDVRIDKATGINKGEAFNALGATTGTKGIAVTESGAIKLEVNTGDAFAHQLAEGANVLKLLNTPTGCAKRLFVELETASAGSASTITWTEPGNNAAGEAQEITWKGGAPSVPSGHNEKLFIELFTIDGIHWIGSVVQGLIEENQLQGAIKQKLIASEAPSALAAHAEGGTGFEPSATKGAILTGEVACASATRTVIKILVGSAVGGEPNTLVAEPAVSVTSTGVTKVPFCFFVGAGRKWKWEKVEGTVESEGFKTSTTIL